MAAGVAVFVWDFIRHRWTGPRAERNPWGAGTLEWLYPPVAPGHNFHSIPRIHSREPLWDQPELLDNPAHKIDGILRDAPHGYRETVGCHPVTGEPLQIVRLPNPTWVPFWAAFGLALLFGATLASLYWVCAIGAVVSLIAFTIWAWEPSQTGDTHDSGQEGILPVDAVDPRGHTHIATIGTLLIMGSLFASLLFAVLYLWNVRPDMAEIAGQASVIPIIVAGITGVAVAALAMWARHSGGSLALDIGVSAATIITSAALVVGILPIDPQATALGATLWATVAFVITHLVVVFLWSLFMTARKFTGMVAPGQTRPELHRATYAKTTAVMVVVTAFILVVGP